MYFLFLYIRGLKMNFDFYFIFDEVREKWFEKKYVVLSIFFYIFLFKNFFVLEVRDFILKDNFLEEKVLD